MTLNNKAEREAEGEIMSDLQYAPRAMDRTRDCVGAKRERYEGAAGGIDNEYNEEGREELD